MKLSRLLGVLAIASLPRVAAAGGLFLPGSGAVSTSRAGAGVASADDGEAIALNPAGIAKAKGTTITLSAAMLSYAMQFQRRGTYDNSGEGLPYDGQRYPLEKNDAKPPLGFASVQPVPVIAVISDLGGVVPGLHVGLGLYAPNAYPFRDICTQTANGCLKYRFNQEATEPPTTRYDIMKQEAAILLPSLDLAYRVLPQLDVGVRLSAGFANLKSTTAVWGSANANYAENVKQDGTFAIDASDRFVPAFGVGVKRSRSGRFVPAFGVGVTYRPTPNLELAANYSSELDIHSKGGAVAQLGSEASMPLPGVPATVGPVLDQFARCATGGTSANDLKACVDLALPMSVTIGGRYKFLDHAGGLRADIELDLDWENWGKTCTDQQLEDGSCINASDYRVVVDGQANVGAGAFPLQTSIVRHNLKDGYGAHLGGSYHIPLGAEGASDEVVVRGGIGYDTRVARDGWLRADLDGAARTTLALGAGYRARRFEVNVGGGVVLEGSPSNPNIGGGAQPCNPSDNGGCNGIKDGGPNPVQPILTLNNQQTSPINQGDFKSHYVMFMLGASTWF
ncbi:MAG TPA: outer membrane protein transport protein [Kofleriaceae bacterium]|nr:outer membrane protein transport protein [Kofleriaceae bacterium]